MERTVGDSVPVAIWDPNPIFRRGLAELLREAGCYHPVEPSDLVSWLRSSTNRVVICTVDGAAPLDLLRELVRRRPDVVLITLLPVFDGDSAATALRAGASSVAARDEEPDRLRLVVDLALRGDALLPIDLARLLAHTPPVDAIDQIGLTPDEIRWIDGLANNQSVARIAADAGVSERTLYRRLDQVFRRIGVSGRLEAIAWATRHGYLDEHRRSPDDERRRSPDGTPRRGG